MTKKKQKLELTWIGKEKRPRLEPRILLEDKALSYRAAEPVTDKDIHDNILFMVIICWHSRHWSNNTRVKLNVSTLIHLLILVKHLKTMMMV
jgi:hypothetical protein